MDDTGELPCLYALRVASFSRVHWGHRYQLYTATNQLDGLLALPRPDPSRARYRGCRVALDRGCVARAT